MTKDGIDCVRYVCSSAIGADALLGLLSQFDFYAFETIGDSIYAFAAADTNVDQLDEELRSLSEKTSFHFTREDIPHENWNEKWEKNFLPLFVDDWCSVRATFHVSNPEADIELIINPQMAFGTGHHETTYMMLSCMKEMNFSEKQVFDYGFGTGILAILSSKMGAKAVEGIDNDQNALYNALENTSLNDVDKINFECCGLADWQKSTYDVIFANINRHVLVESLGRLCNMLEPNGVLLLSGVLFSDREEMANNFGKKLSLIEERHRGDWICQKYLNAL